MTAVASRHLLGAQIVFVASILGVLAGLVQATAGSDIADWTGSKASPAALGLLTVALSGLAGGAALTLRRADTRAGGRLAAAAVIAVTGLVCFTTVGRLWLVPGPLLLIGALLTVEHWKEASAMVRRDWLHILIAALGGCELLMAAGASPMAMAVGGAGGIALIVAAWVVRGSRLYGAGLMVLGTVPFAVVAWTALVPVLLLLVTAGLATSVLHAARPGTRRVGPTRESHGFPNDSTYA